MKIPSGIALVIITIIIIIIDVRSVHDLLSFHTLRLLLLAGPYLAFRKIAAQGNTG